MCIAARWIDSVVDVVRSMSGSAGDWKVDCKYCLGLSSTITEENDHFWDSFIVVLSGIPKEENIFIGSDMNSHVGRDADGYGDVHGGMGFGTRNAEG